jgi:hypothetical protein
MAVVKRFAALWDVSSIAFHALAALLLFAAFLPNAGAIQALELSGVLSLVDRPDSFSVDFSELDTPRCEIGLGLDTVNDPDMIFILIRAQSPALFLLRTPMTPSTDSMTISVDRFSGSSSMPAYAVNTDSLRRIFLPVAASVNPECIQSGQCDTAGYDRYHLFWAYSSDGTFGGTTGIARTPEQPRATAAISMRGNGYALYDLQGRRAVLADKMPPRNRLVIMEDRGTGRMMVRFGIRQRVN